MLSWWGFSLGCLAYGNKSGLVGNPAVRGSCYTMRTTTEYTVNNRYSQGNNMPGHGPGSDTSGPSDRSIGGLPGGSMRVSWDT